jgi:hypothetical protein
MSEGMITRRFTPPPPPAPFEATGGTVTEITDGGIDYKVHTFTSSGTFEVLIGEADVEYLVVAGGGSGGGGSGAIAAARPVAA